MAEIHANCNASKAFGAQVGEGTRFIIDLINGSGEQIKIKHFYVKTDS